MEDPVVSVIVVNWNTRDILRDCLASISACTGVPHEIIVVDNASADGTADMVRTEFPAVHLIANDDNRGFAAANNQGLAVARGRYFLLLNPDTIVLEDVIDRSLAFAEEHPDVAAMGCQVMLAEDEVQQTCFSFPGPLCIFLIQTGLHRAWPRSRFFGRPEIGWWDRDDFREVDVVSGMYMLVRQDAVEDVGLMDEDYFVYAEEADWCYRFYRKGWKCVFAPVGRILHLEGGSKSTEQTPIRARMYVQMQKSLVIFNRKNLGAVAGLTVRGIFLVSMLARAAVFAVPGLLRPEAAAKAALARAAAAYHLTGRFPKA